MSGEINYQRYLRAKQTVDTRSLNRDIYEYIKAYCRTTIDSQLHIVEVGCGLGHFIDDVASWVDATTYYTGIDNNANNIQYISNEYLDGISDGWTDVTGELEEMSLRVQLMDADIFEITNDDLQRPADVVIGKALVDLVPLEAFLDHIRTWSCDGTLLYCPITFNGTTTFKPAHDLDEKVLSIYHASMEAIDSRTEQPKGGTRAGARLVSTIESSDWEALAVAVSDWQVEPDPSSQDYLYDEAYFLRHLLYFIEKELQQSHEITQEEIQCWISDRLAQLDDAVLSLRVHNLDILARR